MRIGYNSCEPGKPALREIFSLMRREAPMLLEEGFAPPAGKTYGDAGLEPVNARPRLSALN